MKREFSKNTTEVFTKTINPNMLRQIINDILMIHKNIEKVKF